MEAAARGRTVESQRREERRWRELARVPEAGTKARRRGVEEDVLLAPPLAAGTGGGGRSGGVGVELVAAPSAPPAVVPAARALGFGENSHRRSPPHTLGQKVGDSGRDWNERRQGRLRRGVWACGRAGLGPGAAGLWRWAESLKCKWANYIRFIR